MKRKPIKDLLCRETEKPILEQLYLQHCVATEQLRREPGVLSAITNAFNRMTGQDFDEGILLRYMSNRRKDKDWPKLGTAARKFVAGTKLVPADLEPALREIYEDMDQTSDDILFDTAKMGILAQRFHEATGIRITGSDLVAFIFGKRKRGDWVRIRDDVAFSDIEEVARTAKRA